MAATAVKYEMLSKNLRNFFAAHTNATNVPETIGETKTCVIRNFRSCSRKFSYKSSHEKDFDQSEPRIFVS